MTAATLTAASLKERLADIIDCAIQGAWPADDCAACKGRATGKCDGCTQQEADVKILNAALGEVQDAASNSRAVAAYLRCFIALTGIPGDDWSVGIADAAEGGNGND